MHTGKIVTPMLAHHTAGWDSSLLGFFKGLIGQPAILVGLFALVGCLIQRKKATDTIVSTLKVIIGFFIITAGAAVLAKALENLTNVLSNTFGLASHSKFIIPSNEAMLSWFLLHSSNVMTTATIILLLGMILNIFMAKFSKMKFIYLSGHLAFYLSIAIAAALNVAGIKVMQNVEDTFIAIISGSMLLALYMVVSPAINQKYASKVTGKNNLAIGHLGGVNFYIAGLIGQGIGKLEAKRKKTIKYTEDIKISKKWMFLKNSIVSTTLTMFVVFTIISIVGLSLRGLDVFNTPEGSLLGHLEWTGVNWGNAIIFPLIQTFVFTAGIQIIIFGVKMFLEELQPAFSGISSKLVKGAKPAVEVQAFWYRNPNAVIIGFLSSFTSGLVLFGIFTSIHFVSSSSVQEKLPIILPQLLPHFFIGSIAAIWANVHGGVKGAITGSSVSGMILTILPIVFFNVGLIPEELIYDISSSWADPDSLAAVGHYGLAQTNKYVMLAVVIVLFTIPIIFNYVMKIFGKKKTATKEVQTKK